MSGEPGKSPVVDCRLPPGLMPPFCEVVFGRMGALVFPGGLHNGTRARPTQEIFRTRKISTATYSHACADVFEGQQINEERWLFRM